MRMHAAPCFYHHCATVNVEGGNAGTSTSPGEGSGSSTGDGDTGMTSPPGTSSSATNGNQTTSAEGTSAGSDETGTPVNPPGETTPATEEEDGCGCTSGGAGGPFAFLAGLLGIAGLRSRRRR
jgi:MYXO-CTERM domain-containing protein